MKWVSVMHPLGSIVAGEVLGFLLLNFLACHLGGICHRQNSSRVNKTVALFRGFPGDSDSKASA